ncbi:MAG: VPLPA-CTERM sorting domain-containing protein [Gammaproteobacteria bacterium]
MNTLKSLVGVSLLGASLAASAASVTLTNFSSSQPDRFAIPGGDLIGDGTVVPGGFFFDLPLVNFTASNNVANDTLSFTIQVGPGEVIKEVIFREAGEVNIVGGGFYTAVGEITVNGVSKTAGNAFGFVGVTGNTTFDFDNGAGGQLFDFSASAGLTSANVTLTNILSAFALPGLENSATITKTTAQLLVVTQPIPLPPAAWMLGSALVGLVTVGRRRLAA